MHQKGLEFEPVIELAKLNFTYITVHTKIPKAGHGFDDRPEHPSVQINSSSPCPNTYSQTEFGSNRSKSSKLVSKTLYLESF